MSTASSEEGHASRTSSFLSGLLPAVYLFVLLRTAWLCDDAYISFRTIDNWIEGYGLVWNAGERVQTFTHPLWVLLLSIPYFFTHEIYLTSLAASMLLSFAAVVLLGFKIARTPAAAVLAMAALIMSKAFVDYSTSGLENPLTHLLVALFAMAYFAPWPAARKVFPCALVMGLAMVNRTDTVLLFAPALLLLLFETRSLRSLAAAAAGFCPFVLWTAFALFYYGFPFPNTAYAKLSTGIPMDQAILEGVGHMVSAITWLPFSMALLLAGIFLPLAARDWRALPLSVGILLYVAYFVRVGGDFMLGRFLTAPLFISAVMLARLPLSPRGALPAVVLVVLAGLAGPYPTVLSGARYGMIRQSSGEQLPFRDERNVSDHRGTFYQTTGLLKARNRDWRPVHHWALRGDRLAGRNRVTVHGAVGFYGYNVGPSEHVIDYYALGDPLLARLPLAKGQGWRSGHYRRRLPEGYRESVASGENKLADPGLAAYYDKLRLIVQGPLWSRERLEAIWKMNTGQYDALLTPYIEEKLGGGMGASSPP